ncbi:MAG TPA: monovalent cation/H(+) antiporter subunit G [Candidatus Thermoplasmatota archaeon]|nr:monovalent cation/H(+) antiporter subunit G [Candidatus Thermoplasmatota archaeon]
MIFDFIIYALIGIGIFFNVLAGVGLLRFPDVYTRLHAGTKCTTFGSIFLIGSVILIGLKMWWEKDTNGSVLAIHSALALIAILLTNPVGAHAIARAAHRSGVQPARAVIDELAQKPTEKTQAIDKKINQQKGGD